MLSKNYDLFVVDTSNEICGDGNVVHSSVGLACRIMVPSLERQNSIMIECLHNHTPAVMVVEELGRLTEVEAARTVRQRGVCIIASAHGDLRSLPKNVELRGLVGNNVTSNTVGDSLAEKNGGRKEIYQRQRRWRRIKRDYRTRKQEMTKL